MSSRCQAEKGADIGCLAEPLRIIDEGDEAERHDWADAGNGHQALRDRVLIGLLCYDRIEFGRCLAECGMEGDEPIGNHAEHRIGFASGGELVAKGLSLAPPPNAGHSDPERLERPTDVSLKIDAQPDQTITGTDQAAKPVRRIAANVNRREPAGAGKLRQSFRIGGVGLVQPRRECLVRLSGINAHGRQPKADKTALQPN